MKKLFTFLAKPATYAACLSAFLLFGIFVLPWKSAQISLYTPEGATFDTSLFYAPAEAQRRAALYSDRGRESYVLDRWTFDLAFPAVYGAFMLSSWAFGLSRIGRKNGNFGHRFLAVPLLAVVFDLAENISVTVIMLSFPAAPYPALFLASASTLLKWIFVGTAFAGSAILPLSALAVHIVRRKNKAPTASK